MECTGKVDTSDWRVGRTVRLSSRALIHVNNASRVVAARCPALFAYALVVWHSDYTSLLVDASAVTAQCLVRARRTVIHWRSTMYAEEVSRTLASIAALIIETGGAILTTQVCAHEELAFVDIDFAANTL